MMTFSLQSDRVAVIAEPVVNKTASGLELPDTAVNNVPRYGTVAAVGIGHRSEQTGELVPIDVEPGDRVFFHRMSGELWEIGDETYTVLSPREIIGIDEPGVRINELGPLH
jgi:chaperonin GroES